MIRLKTIIKNLLVKLPGKYILLESVPDVSDNTKAVFDEMIRRGLNKKYKFIWLCNDSVREYPKHQNVIYFPPIQTTANQIQLSYYFLRAKLSIFCNRIIVPSNPYAFTMYLTHGTGIKNSRNSIVLPDTIRYVLVTSEYAKNVAEWEFSLDRARFIALGFPRNDVLSEKRLDLHSLFPGRSFEKIVIWYPTFRQHKKGYRTGASHPLPIVWDEKKAIELNTYAEDLDVLIVLKPHFAQDVSAIKKLNLSHMVFIDETFFERNGISSYRLVGSCDALLTDYSSIYYDYTLCDKPIGLIWEDYDEYAKDPGFGVDMNVVMKGGEKIFTLEELKLFISDVAYGIDRRQKERREIRDLFNYSTDGKNSERVVDFIIENADL